MTAQRHVAILRASWAMLDEAVAAWPSQLRKGPCEVGRDRDEILCHVIEAERAYARKIGVRHKPFEMNDTRALIPNCVLMYNLASAPVAALAGLLARKLYI